MCCWGWGCGWPPSSPACMPPSPGSPSAWLTPAVPFQRPKAVSREAHRIADDTVDDPDPPDADAPQWLHLAGLTREAVSPLARTEHLLHPWTSYLIVPLFALANAGVSITSATLREALTSGVTLGVVVGLVVGKTVGVTAFAWVATRTGITRLPDGVRWRHLLGVAALAGIGFTVSLFITSLAFQSPAAPECGQGRHPGRLAAGRPGRRAALDSIPARIGQLNAWWRGA